MVGPSAAGRRLEVVRAAVRPDVPEATVARLPLYLRALHALAERGLTTVSSEALAGASGVGSAKLRKDLSHLGSYGTRGVGYDVDELVRHISAALGLGRRWAVVLVGVGNLGHALAGYGGFDERGFRVVGLFDVDPARVGEQVGDLRGPPPRRACRGRAAARALHRRASRRLPPLPQPVCDRLVEAGSPAS
jgi:redox-sensing transcriptional repressor